MAGDQGVGELGQALQRLVFRLSRELRVHSAAAGVSGADALSLYEVHRRPGIGVTELAAIEKVGRSVMSERVARLEAAGLLERSQAPGGDRRRVGLEVTGLGRAALLEISGRRRDWMAERLANLTEEERAAVHLAVRSLERLLRRPAKSSKNDEP